MVLFYALISFITFFVWFLKYLTRTRDIGANKKVDDLFGSASWETEEKMIKAKLITPNNKKRAFDKREVIVGRRGLGILSLTQGRRSLA